MLVLEAGGGKGGEGCRGGLSEGGPAQLGGEVSGRRGRSHVEN